jgi:hypothetical protein
MATKKPTTTKKTAPSKNAIIKAPVKAAPAKAKPKAAKAKTATNGAAKAASDTKKSSPDVPKRRGRPVNPERQAKLAARKAKIEAEIKAGLRAPGARGPAKSTTKGQNTKKAAAKAKTAAEIAAGLRGARGPKRKADSKASQKRERVEAAVKAGLRTPGQKGRLQTAESAARARIRAKAKADRTLLMNSTIPEKVEPHHLEKVGGITGWRGKTNIEAKRWGDRMVKIMTRRGTIGERSYEAIRTLEAKKGEKQWRALSSSLIYKDKNGDGGYRDRLASPKGRKYDVTMGADVRGGKTVNEIYKPNRTAANYGNSSFWAGMSHTDGRPVDTTPRHVGPTRSSIVKVIRVLDPHRPGKGAAHKGGRYIKKNRKD